jgi:hypothetical protein
VNNGGKPTSTALASIASMRAKGERMKKRLAYSRASGRPGRFVTWYW